MQWSSDGRYLLVALSGLWRIEPPNNRRIDVGGANTRMSPFEPYLWLEDDIAVVDRILTLSEPIKERVETVNRCDAFSLTFDRGRMACFGRGSNTIQVIDIQSGQTTRIKFSIQYRGGLHWLIGSDFLIMETATPSEVADLWLVNINGADPSLITRGNFVAALSAK